MKDPYSVVKTICVTEKGTALNQVKTPRYQLVVDKRANKIEIKYAVEQLFKVKVTQVNTAHVRGKLRRQRTAQAGRTPSWKKATVTLQEGQTIDVG
ncbi:50S ribosomal protein L23 [bacterium]|nr:50S ribosomal protein L23 [bacterium]